MHTQVLTVLSEVNVQIDRGQFFYFFMHTKWMTPFFLQLCVFKVNSGG